MHQDGISALQSAIITVGLSEESKDKANTEEAQQDDTMTKEEKDVVLICLRATFGNATNPALFSILSETTTNLANQLLEIEMHKGLPKSEYEFMIKEEKS